MYFSITWGKNNKTSNSPLNAYRESKFNLCIRNFVHPLIPVLSTEGLAWGSLAIAGALELLGRLHWESRWAPPALREQRGPSRAPPPPAELPLRRCRLCAAAVCQSLLHPGSAHPKPGRFWKPQPPSCQGPGCCLRRSFLGMTSTLPILQETTRSSGVKNVPPWDSS